MFYIDVMIKNTNFMSQIVHLLPVTQYYPPPKAGRKIK